MKLLSWQKIWSEHRTTLQLLLMQVAAAGTAFVVNILSASVMDPEGRGYLALLVQITYVLTVLAMLGIERPYVAARRTDFRQAVFELLRLVSPGYFVLGATAIVAVFLLLGDREAYAISAGLIIFYLLGNICSRLIRTGYIASSHIPPFLVVSVGTQFALLAMAVMLFLFQSSSPDSWFLAYGLSGLVAVTATGYALVRHRRGSVRRAEERLIRRDGLRLLPASFGNTAMLRSDRLLLPFLASNAQLGIYIVVATTMELASWPVQNWVDASLNRWRRDHHDHGSKVKAIVGAMALTLLLAIGMGLASFILIRFVLGDSYAGSMILILPLGLATIVYAASRVQQGLLIAAGRSNSVSVSETVGMAVSVGCYFIFIPMFGALGAAIASIIGYSACFLAGLLLMRRKME